MYLISDSYYFYSVSAFTVLKMPINFYVPLSQWLLQGVSINSIIIFTLFAHNVTFLYGKYIFAKEEH